MRLIAWISFEEPLHHRTAAALALGRLEEAVSIYLTNELFAEAPECRRSEVWTMGSFPIRMDCLDCWACMVCQEDL